MIKLGTEFRKYFEKALQILIKKPNLKIAFIF